MHPFMHAKEIFLAMFFWLLTAFGDAIHNFSEAGEF